MLRTALVLLTALTVNCLVEVDSTRAIVDRQMRDWETALNSGDVSGLLGTFKKDPRVCFNGQCGTGLEAFQPVLMKYDSFKIRVKEGTYAKDHAYISWTDSITLKGCSVDLEGSLFMYIKDGKVVEEHCFCDANLVAELFICAGILPSSGDEL